MFTAFNCCEHLSLSYMLYLSAVFLPYCARFSLQNSSMSFSIIVLSQSVAIPDASQYAYGSASLLLLTPPEYFHHLRRQRDIIVGRRHILSGKPGRLSELVLL